MNGKQTRTIVALLGLSVLCASVNLTKAVHIDDTAYLAMAAAIIKDPLHPMSGSINWGDTRRPIHELNQPILWPAAMAAVMYVFGESELALHGLMAVASTAAVFLFFAMARRLIPAEALFSTALLALGPAFLPGQNLMVDVPLLALWLAAFYALLRARREPSWYAVSAVAIGAACLVKYTSLVLLPVFACIVFSRGDRTRLRLLSMPALMLVAWSAFNYAEYGGIHLMQRDLEPFPGTHADRVLEWLAGLGAVSPFVVAYLPGGGTNGAATRVAWLAGSVGLLVAWIAVRGPNADAQLALLWGVFVTTGVLTLSHTALAARLGMTGASDARADSALLLTLWLAATFAFVVGFAPFIAVRHILLSVPPVLLLLAAGSQRASRRRRGFALIATVSLGLWLAYADHQQADVYRRQAKRIRSQLPGDSTIWYVGHWGWQWYAAREGMLPYDSETTSLSAGDFVIVPAMPHRQRIAARDRQRMRRQGDHIVPATPTTWLRTMSASPWGGYYAYWFLRRSVPWRFSTQPLETFTIFRVGDDSGSPGEVARRFDVAP